TFPDTATKDHPMRTNRTPTATTMRPRGPTARRAYRARRSLRLMRLLHDLATREHDPEEEKDGHRACVDDDLNPSDELREEEQVDARDRDQRDREPEHVVHELLGGDGHHRGPDLEPGQDEEGDDL